MSNIFQWIKDHPARAGTLAGWFQQGCGMLVALMIIPIVTRYLSPNESGIWFSFQGLVSMIGLVDLGFGFAISRQAAFTLGATQETLATDDFIHLSHGWEGVAQLFHLTRTLYRWLALAAALLALFAYEIISRFGHLVPSGTVGVRECWYAMAAATVILILVGGQSALLNGLGAVYQTRFLGGLNQLAAGAGAAFAASMGWGLPAMGFSFTLSAIIYSVSISFLQRFMARPMHNVPNSPPNSGSLRRLACAALPVGGVNVFGSLVYTIQAPMLGFLLGPSTVAPFYLAQKIAISCNLLAMQTAMPQLPFFTRALGAGNITAARDNMRRTIIRASILVVVSSAGFFFIGPFAAKILLHKMVFVDLTTRLLMSLDLVALGCTVIWAFYVLGSGTNPFVRSTIYTSLTSLIITLILVPRLGVSGLPISTLVAGVMFNYRKSIIEGRKLFINKLSA